MSEFYVSAPARKRAELAGEIAAAEVRLHEMRGNPAHVDATIHLFTPDYPIAQIAPKKLQPARPVLFEGVSWGERSSTSCGRRRGDGGADCGRGHGAAGGLRLGVRGESWGAALTRLCGGRMGRSSGWHTGHGR